MIEKKDGFLVDRQSGDVIKIESIQSIYKYGGPNMTPPFFGISINFKKGSPVYMQYEKEHLREQAIREIIDLL